MYTTEIKIDRAKAIRKWMPIIERLFDGRLEYPEVIETAVVEIPQMEELCYIAEVSAMHEAIAQQHYAVMNNGCGIPSVDRNDVSDSQNNFIYLPMILRAIRQAIVKCGINFTFSDSHTTMTAISLLNLSSTDVVGQPDITSQIVENICDALTRIKNIEDNVTINSLHVDAVGNNLILNIKSTMENTNAATPAPVANFQECAALEIENLFPGSGDTLGDIMNLQRDIQESVYGYNWKNLQEGQIGDLKKFIDWNEEALRDESREFASALTGIHTYPMCWKPWKSKHKEAMARSLKDLTPEELLELKFEWIDQLHFFLNIGLAIGMTPQETYNMYYSKNKENRARQQKAGGY